MLNSSFIQSKKSLIYGYLKSIANGDNTSALLAKSLNLSQITTVAYLRRFKKENYLNVTQRYKNKALVYNLTPRGNKILELYSRIEKGEDI
jgi:predicted transcriptional regulator